MIVISKGKGINILKIFCIGDSLTEGDYGIAGSRGIGNVKEKGFPYFLSRYLGVETVNAGKCGYTSTKYLAYYKDGKVNVAGSDIILIFLGTNGRLDPDEEIQGNADYLELIRLCERDAPSAEIILCVPPRATENPAYSNCGYMPKIEKAVRFVRRFAAENGYKTIDLFECPDFTPENEAIMQPNDGLHFGEEGYRTMAYYIGDRLKEISDRF